MAQKRHEVRITSKGIYSVGKGQVAGPGHVHLTDEQIENLKRTPNIEYVVLGEQKQPAPVTKPITEPVIT